MSTLKLQPRRRHLAATLTVAITSAFIAFVVLAVGLLGSSVRAQVEGQLEGASALVQPTFNQDGTPAVIDQEALAQVDGVQNSWIHPQGSLAVLVSPGEEASNDPFSTKGVFSTLVATRDGVPANLVSGSAPSSPTDVVIDESLAERYTLATGDTVRLQSSSSGEVREFTVSGIRQPPRSQMFSGTTELVVTDAAIIANDTPADADAEAGVFRTYTYGVQAKDGVSEKDLVASLTAAGFDAKTATEVRDAGNQMAFAVMAGFGTLLAGFIVIALATSVLVVSNSFAVTMAQRRRSFALARALGATRAQVMASVVRDSLLVGIIGAVIGVVLAYAGFWGLLTLGRAVYTKALPAVPEFNLLAILLPLAMGLVLTLVASLVPALSATRVKPLEALRPVEATRGPGASRVRSIIGLVIVAVGVVATAGGVFLAARATEPSGWPMAVAVLGGLVLLLGTIVILPAIVRPLMRVFGAASAPVGKAPAKFAALNAARHPKRTATTISALIIGSALMAMMSTGAATAERTLVDDLTSRMPVDAIVAAEQLPEDIAPRMQSIQGVNGALAVDSAELPTSNGDMTVFAADPADLDAISNRAGLSDLVADGDLTVGTARAEHFGLKDGEAFTVTGTDGSTHEVTVRITDNLDLSLLTPATLKELGVPLNQGIFVKFDAPNSPARGDVTASGLTTEVMDTAQGDAVNVTYSVSQGAERETYSQIISVMLTSTFVLLAVAVLVALVGVANTLSLSVVERSSENALLRALGTSRAQIQATLAWEGAFIALAGAVIGIVLGVAFGLVGVYTLLSDGIVYQPTVPWLALGAVLILALLAGIIASIVPGRVASRAQPAAALAQRDD
ncbi:MAG: FtsX-like permease family protein [Dermabacter sp.]|nr:FtsX-like permease family protein [Dermabacter sp.]